MVFNFIGGGLYGLSITNVSGDVCTDGSCSIFVLLDHPISRKTWSRISTKEVTLTASEKRNRGGVPPLFSWRKTMKEMKHFGVYGVCIREGRILCIRKTRGPYRGRFDLPGGTPEEGESLVETLRREMLEETGFQVSAIHQNTIRDVFVTIPEIARVHHEFVLFTIDVEEKNAQTVEDFVTSEEKNDSKGIVWVPLEEVSVENASPLVIEAAQPTEAFEAKHYEQWVMYDEDFMN